MGSLIEQLQQTAQEQADTTISLRDIRSIRNLRAHGLKDCSGSFAGLFVLKTIEPLAHPSCMSNEIRVDSGLLKPEN